MTKLTQGKQVQFSEVFPANWMNAINIITKRLPIAKKLNDDEDFAISLLDHKWQIEMVWAAYYHNPVLNIRRKPFNTPDFQVFKTSGKSYAEQLRLTVAVWDRSPQHNFETPMNWWIEQMLDCKRSDYRHALEERSQPLRKKETIRSNYLQVRILRGIEGSAKDQNKLIDGFCEAIPSMGLLLRKATNLAKNSNSRKGKRFITQYWNPYLDSVRENIEYTDRGGHGSKIQMIQKLQGKVHLTAPRRPRLLIR